MKLEQIIQAAVGTYLILPGIEDWASGGLTLAPSALIGAVLLTDALGVDLFE